MGRSGNIGWGTSSYFRLPNRKRKLLTKEFLQTFKEEIIKLKIAQDKEYNCPQIDYMNETYYGFYGHIEGSYLFYEALKNACEKHNLTEAIYTYAQKMDWYDSDCFDDDLVLEMVNKGVIQKDKPEDYNFVFELEDKVEYKLIKYYKGYNVVKYGDWFSDNKQRLEEIYKDSDGKLIWLD